MSSSTSPTKKVTVSIDPDPILVSSTIGGGGVPGPGDTTPTIVVADFDVAKTVTSLEIDFTDTSYIKRGSGTIDEWLWDFGDGEVSTSQNPTHTYGAQGQYEVSLVVVTDDDATDVYSQYVTVRTATGDDGADIKTAFTYIPNPNITGSPGQFSLVVFNADSIDIYMEKENDSTVKLEGVGTRGIKLGDRLYKWLCTTDDIIQEEGSYIYVATARSPYGDAGRFEYHAVELGDDPDDVEITVLSIIPAIPTAGANMTFIIGVENYIGRISLITAILNPGITQVNATVTLISEGVYKAVFPNPLPTGNIPYTISVTDSEDTYTLQDYVTISAVSSYTATPVVSLASAQPKAGLVRYTWDAHGDYGGGLANFLYRLTIDGTPEKWIALPPNSEGVDLEGYKDNTWFFEIKAVYDDGTESTVEDVNITSATGNTSVAFDLEGTFSTPDTTLTWVDGADAGISYVRVWDNGVVLSGNIAVGTETYVHSAPASGAHVYSIVSYDSGNTVIGMSESVEVTAS